MTVRRFIASQVRRLTDPHTDQMVRNLDERVKQAVDMLGSVALLVDAGVFTKAQTVELVALTPGTTVSIDGRLSNNFTLLLGQNTTIKNPINVKPGQILNLSLFQNTTGGFTVTWGSAFLFPGGVPTITATASAKDIVSGIVIEATDGVATEIHACIGQVLGR